MYLDIVGRALRLEGGWRGVRGVRRFGVVMGGEEYRGDRNAV